MEVTIKRFDLYPSEEPYSYAVGFNIITANSRTFYRDTLVLLEEVPEFTDEQIVEAAWNKLKDGILTEVTRLESKSPLVGAVWNPPE